MSKLKQEIIDKIIKLHIIDNLGTSKIKNITGISKAAIRHNLIKNNVYNPPTHKPKTVWTKEMIQFLRNYYPSHTAEECAEKLNLTEEQVVSKIKCLIKNGEKINKIYHDPIKMEEFHNITKPEIAYFLGLFYADGSIRTQWKSSTISLIIEDSRMVKDVINSLGKTHYRESFNRKNRKPIGIFNIYSKGLWQFLYNNDYYEKSTRSAGKILSKIPENLQNYFFRGFLDGDGCICLEKNTRKAKIIFSGSFNQDWEFIKDKLNNLKITYGIYRRTNRKNQKYSNVSFASKMSVLEFCNYIYKNREFDKIGFNRKYNKFLEFKKRNGL